MKKLLLLVAPLLMLACTSDPTITVLDNTYTDSQTVTVNGLGSYNVDEVSYKVSTYPVNGEINMDVIVPAYVIKDVQIVTPMMTRNLGDINIGSYTIKGLKYYRTLEDSMYYRDYAADKLSVSVKCEKLGLDTTCKLDSADNENIKVYFRDSVVTIENSFVPRGFNRTITTKFVHDLRDDKVKVVN